MVKIAGLRWKNSRGAGTVDLKKVYRIKSSVALVYTKGILDVFLANTREQFSIEINYRDIVDLLFSFDGKRTLEAIVNKNDDISQEEIFSLVDYLNKKRALIDVDKEYSQDCLATNYRLISLLEDYFISTSGVVRSLKLLSEKSVMVVGMGAVGTWIVDSLARSGVRNFTIVDDDVVEMSNLHRQNFFFESDVGRSKVDAVNDKLNFIDSNFNVNRIKSKLTSEFFEENTVSYDVVVNCADFPSVDVTTEIISKESMKRGLPHIVGGGYNLHLTLVGQTVIPNVTPCFNCFKDYLKKLNKADLEGVKKLTRKNRKIGSFSPFCSISASLTALDVIKILIEKNEFINNAGKRIEFTVEDRDLKQFEIPKNPDCSWCGENGVYSK